MSDVQKALNRIRKAVTSLDHVADEIESYPLFDAINELEVGLYYLKAALETEEELEVSVG